jgi:hypothetical protein
VTTGSYQAPEFNGGKSTSNLMGRLRIERSLTAEPDPPTDHNPLPAALASFSAAKILRSRA